MALCRIQTWGIIEDGQGCHHLSSTPQPWDSRQPTHHVYAIDYYSSRQGYPSLLGLSTRAYATRADDEPAKKYE
jgi:hypothetical protein